MSRVEKEIDHEPSGKKRKSAQRRVKSSAPKRQRHFIKEESLDDSMNVDDLPSIRKKKTARTLKTVDVDEGAYTPRGTRSRPGVVKCATCFFGIIATDRFLRVVLIDLVRCLNFENW